MCLLIVQACIRGIVSGIDLSIYYLFIYLNPQFQVVHLGEVFGYVAFLQKNYGLTPEQLNKLAQLPEVWDVLVAFSAGISMRPSAPAFLNNNRIRYCSVLSFPFSAAYMYVKLDTFKLNWTHYKQAWRLCNQTVHPANQVEVLPDKTSDSPRRLDIFFSFKEDWENSNYLRNCLIHLHKK